MDPLLAEIIADPDNDAPRLVWADREGGDRGELVVVQCMIASGKGDDALREREYELLQRRARWEPPIGIWPLYHRGFPDSLRIESDKLASRFDEIFAAYPTVQKLDLVDTARYLQPGGPPPASEWADALERLRQLFHRYPPGFLRSISLSAAVLVDAGDDAAATVHPFGDSLVNMVAHHPALEELRALLLVSTGLTERALPDLARLRKLRALRIDRHRLGPKSLCALLRAAPTVVELAPWNRVGGWTPGDLRAFFESPEFARLERVELVQRDITGAGLGVVDRLPPALKSKVIHYGRPSK